LGPTSTAFFRLLYFLSSNDNNFKFLKYIYIIIVVGKRQFFRDLKKPRTKLWITCG
jgi:hypothetical protein